MMFIPRVCIVCGRQFLAAPAQKMCSKWCLRIRKQDMARAYEIAIDRSEYYRDYHAAHRAERKARMLARKYPNGPPPKRQKSTPSQLRARHNARVRRRRAAARAASPPKPKPSPLMMKQRRERSALIEKVAKAWCVPAATARAMIDAGSFPP